MGFWWQPLRKALLEAFLSFDGFCHSTDGLRGSDLGCWVCESLLSVSSFALNSWCLLSLSDSVRRLKVREPGATDGAALFVPGLT